MKAATIHEQGGPEVLLYEDMPDPACGPEDVVIDVEAISLEGGDLLNRSILPVESFPHVIGYGAAGTVAEVGAEVTHLRPGDKAAGFSFAGSHAEKFKVPGATAFKLPDGLDIGVASTMPVTFGTADEALFERGQLRNGESVLITGGTGGVGMAAIQLAKAAGATVFATCRAAAADALRALGCDHPVAYDRGDYAEDVIKLTDGRGVDLVVDMVGGDGTAMSRLISTIAYQGRLALVGLSGGEAPAVTFWDLAPKNMTVFGVLFGLEMGSPRAHEMLARHFSDAAAGRLTMPVDRTFALSEAAAAHRYAENKKPVGRVLIIP